jgi:hypothetical protein
MAQPEDPAAQALRLAAHALQQISLQSSSSSDDEHDAAQPAPLAAAAPAAAADQPSPLASPKLAHKLLSSVAQVMHALCRMMLIRGWGFGFNLWPAGRQPLERTRSTALQLSGSSRSMVSASGVRVLLLSDVRVAAR